MTFEANIKWPAPHFPEFVLHHLPSGLATVDANLHITYFNPSAERITGYKRAEAVGRYCGQVLQGGQCRFSCPLRTVLNREKTSVTVETTIQTKDGRTLSVNLRTAAMFDEGGALIGALESFSDISHIKKLEAERAQTLSIFAHDMKAPLISIEGFANRLIAGKAGQLNDKQKKYLNMVQTQSRQV
jgi:PAS domain S-box-containing protein